MCLLQRLKLKSSCQYCARNRKKSRLKRKKFYIIFGHYSSSLRQLSLFYWILKCQKVFIVHIGSVLLFICFSCPSNASVFVSEGQVKLKLQPNLSQPLPQGPLGFQNGGAREIWNPRCSWEQDCCEIGLFLIRVPEFTSCRSREKNKQSKTARGY